MDRRPLTPFSFTSVKMVDARLTTRFPAPSLRAMAESETVTTATATAAAAPRPMIAANNS